jgi:hypothetical protein
MRLWDKNNYLNIISANTVKINVVINYGLISLLFLLTLQSLVEVSLFFFL